MNFGSKLAPPVSNLRVEPSPGPQREFRTSVSVPASVQTEPKGEQQETQQEHPPAAQMQGGTDEEPLDHVLGSSVVLNLRRRSDQIRSDRPTLKRFQHVCGPNSEMTLKT